MVGRNVIVAHRNHILRCAPEQVRLATGEERSLVETPETQLLGIKDMIEHGTFRSHQYIDLVAQAYPPQEPAVLAHDVEMPPEPDQAIGHQSSQPASAVSRPELPSVPANEETVEQPNVEVSSASAGPSEAVEVAEAPSGSSDYGPVRRRRLPSKSGPMTLFRPTAMRQEDFVEVMQEVVPHLIEEAVEAEQPTVRGMLMRPLINRSTRLQDLMHRQIPRVSIRSHMWSQPVAKLQNLMSCGKRFKPQRTMPLKPLLPSTITNEHRKRFQFPITSHFCKQKSIKPRSANGRP